MTTSFYPPQRTLMGPGPSDVSSRVLGALSRPTIGHLDPLFVQLMDEIKELLQYAFQTSNELTLPVSAPGSAGMEATVANLIERGDDMLVCVNGVFGKRMTDVAQRYGANVTTVEKPWGEVFTANDLKETLATAKPKVVGIVIHHGDLDVFEV